MQIAIFVVPLYWWVGDTSADKPSLGVLLFICGTLAFVATIIPIAIVEGVKDVRRLYLPAFRRWLSGPRVVAAGGDGGETRRDGRGAGPAPLLRKLPE